MTPVETQFTVAVERFFDEITDEEIIHVSGMIEEDGEEKSYAIEFEPWAEWLAMPVWPNSLKEFNDLEIISHCLYEMTFAGYDEEEIQSTIGVALERLKDYFTRKN